jgi:hypothetical protein
VRASYSDITTRLGAPLWYDENGTPRYDPFTPRMTANIYASEVVLYEIVCQSCGETFLVADSWHVMDDMVSRVPVGSVRQAVEERTLHYGDPPHHKRGEHLCGGTTMNCDDLRTVEFWQRDALDWERVPSLEGVRLNGLEEVTG